jgi:hypothetical protein
VDFAPKHGGQFTATLTLESSDPVGGPISIAIQGNATTDPKDIKDKENKDSKDNKDDPDKSEKDRKEQKDNKENKDSKDNNKEGKDSKEDSKDDKDGKDSKDNKNEDKETSGGHEKPQADIRASFVNPVGWPTLLLEPAQIEGQADQATGRAFIRPDERPELGGPALNEALDERNRMRRRVFPLVSPSGPNVGSGGSEVVQ